MSIVQKIKKFLKKDIRQKLMHFSLYPNFFYTHGIKSIYSKIVFSRILKERFDRFKRDNYKKFFIERGINEKNNFLFSLPRSGSTATRLMLISYFEMLYGIGNGIPKYDPINDKWIFPLSNIQHQELHNSLVYENLVTNMERKHMSLYLSSDEFKKKKIIFSRYPLSNSDIYDVKLCKPVILLREPKDQIISYCVNHGFLSKNLIENNFNIVKKAYRNYQKFIEYWQIELENLPNKDSYIVLKFKDIVSNPKKVLECLLNFFNYEINHELINRATEIHKKENTLEHLKYVQIKKIRFTNLEKKKKLEEGIIKIIKEIDKDNVLEMTYNSFIKKFTSNNN